MSTPTLPAVSAAGRGRTTMEGPVALLFAAVLVTGAIAAMRIAPIIWATTFAVMAVLVREWSTSTFRATAGRPIEDLTMFPPSTRRMILATREHVTSADAKYLLDVVVQGAAPLLAAMSDSVRDRASRRDVVALVEASCALGEELDRVDAFLGQPRVPADVRADGLRERCSATRNRLTDRLTEACTAIETLHAQLLEEQSDAAERVAELATELTEEARVRHDAAAEIDGLLK